MTGSATSITKSEPKTLSTFASLRFSGDQLEPPRLSDLLGALPTTAYRKGEVYKRFRGHEARGRTGLWLLSSKGQVDSLDLNDHLEYLLDAVLPDPSEERLRQIQLLMHDFGLEADASCFWHGEHGAKPPVVRDDIRARLARIPAEIETDFDTD